MPSAEERARCWIVWEHGQVSLREGEHLLGRDADVSVWLESPTVSQHHARIRVSDGSTTIEDLYRNNGTHLSGERISAPAPLVDGNEIRLGSIPVRIRLLKAAGSTVARRSS